MNDLDKLYKNLENAEMQPVFSQEKIWNRIEGQLNESVSKKNKFSFRTISIAASVVIIASVFVLVFKPSKENEIPNLVKEDVQNPTKNITDTDQSKAIELAADTEEKVTLNDLKKEDLKVQEDIAELKKLIEKKDGYAYENLNIKRKTNSPIFEKEELVLPSNFEDNAYETPSTLDKKVVVNRMKNELPPRVGNMAYPTEERTAKEKDTYYVDGEKASKKEVDDLIAADEVAEITYLSNAEAAKIGYVENKNTTTLPVYIIDGKMYATLNIKEENILTKRFIPSETATKLYGDKAVNGVYITQTIANSDVASLEKIIAEIKAKDTSAYSLKEKKQLQKKLRNAEKQLQKLKK